jgi:hypothetical protein
LCLCLIPSFPLYSFSVHFICPSYCDSSPISFLSFIPLVPLSLPLLSSIFLSYFFNFSILSSFFSKCLPFHYPFHTFLCYSPKHVIVRGITTTKISHLECYIISIFSTESVPI